MVAAGAVLARAVLLAAGLVAVCLLLAACASPAAPRSAPVSATATAAPRASRSPAARGGGLFTMVLRNPAATVSGGQLYVAWQVNPVTAAVPRFELARVNQATGAIEAARRLDAGFLGAPLAAGGSLWVTITTAAGDSLLRMNPADLAVTGNTGLGGRSFQGLGTNVAVAGGALWVSDGNRLTRVSPRTGTVLAVVALPGAYSSWVGASGSDLVVGEANDSGVGSVQRRDPVTGALIASHPMLGVTAPRIGGVIGSGVWVSEPTGLLGYVERFSIATMAPEPATDVEGTNGINVRVADGVTWVTDQASVNRNYCADPVTGRRLAPIPFPDSGQDYLLAISGRYVYYQAPAGNGFRLERLAIPAGCLARSR